MFLIFSKFFLMTAMLLPEELKDCTGIKEKIERSMNLARYIADNQALRIFMQLTRLLIIQSHNSNGIVSIKKITLISQD